MSIKRFGYGTDYRSGGIGMPGIIERADGPYVLHSDYALLEQQCDLQQAQLRRQASQMDAIGAGGVSMYGAATHVTAQATDMTQTPVGKVRHFQYTGIARNGFSQEAVLNDDSLDLPDGTLLYTAPTPPAGTQTMTPGELADRIARGEKWGLAEDQFPDIFGTGVMRDPDEQAQQDADKVDAPSNKRWPFVETPMQFATRLDEAMMVCPGLLAAVRHVLIEKPPTLSMQPDPAMAGDELSDDDIQSLLGEYGDHNVEHGQIAYDKWTLLEAGRALLKRVQPASGEDAK